MTQQAPSAGKTEEQLRAELAASLLAARTGRTPSARAPRSTGLVKRLADAPAPPREVNDPLYAAEVLVLAGAAAHWAQVAPWWFVAGGGAAAVSAAVTTHYRLYHRPATLYAALSTAAAGPIVAAGAAYGVLGGAAAAAFGAVVLGPLYGGLRHRHSKKHEKGRTERAAVLAEQKREAWEAILLAAGMQGVRIVRELNDDTWTNGERQLPAAFALALELGDKAPEGRALAGMTPKVEQIAARRQKLPIRSGSIQVNQRGYAHEWEIIVPTRDLLREEIPFVLESGPRSVNDPIFVAMANDGTAIGLDLMETPHEMVAGMTGFGKTTFLNAHLVELTRCTDNVTWVICGKKPHRMLKPWFEAFLRGTPSAESETGFVEPVIDWFAADLYEACKMLLDAYKAIAVRSKSAKGEKWVPSPEHPRITIVIDEPSKFLNDREYKVKPFDWTGASDEKEDELGVKRSGWCFSELLVQVIVAARSEGISVVFAIQRGTNDLAGDEGGTLKSQISARASCKQQGMLEQGKTFISTTVGVDVTRLGKGEFYIEFEDVSRPVLAKAYYPQWPHIQQASIAHTAYAQPIDPATAADLDFYAGRWTRPDQQEFLRELLEGEEPARTIPDQSAQRSTPTAQDSARQVPDVPRSLAEDQVEQAAADLDTSVDALKAMLPELADLDANGVPDDEEPAPPTPWGARIDPTLPDNTRQLLDVLASSNLLYAPEWVTSADILDLAVAELGWPGSSEGYRWIKWALEQAHVEQPNNPPRIAGSRKRQPQGYRVEHIKRALDHYLRSEGDDPAG